jgi:hypothetical protein
MVGFAAAVAAISVAAAAPLTIEVKPAVVVVGDQVNVIVAPGTDRSERMTIEMRSCSDSTWRTVAAARSWPDGYWTAGVHPMLNASVRARVRDTTSAPVRVQVRPYVNLDVLQRPWFRVEVGAGRYLPRKRVYLQQFVNGAWKRVAVTRLQRERAVAYAISSGRFSYRAPAGAKLRAFVPAASCYLSGISRIEERD